MRAHTDGGARAAAGVPRFLDAVLRFFFQPGDGATLGLIRIGAGLLAVYVHLVYGYDLQGYVGKDAWVSEELTTDLRQERPYMEPIWDWSDPDRRAKRPQFRTKDEEDLNRKYAQKWWGPG